MRTACPVAIHEGVGRKWRSCTCFAHCLAVYPKIGGLRPNKLIWERAVCLSAFVAWVLPTSVVAVGAQFFVCALQLLASPDSLRRVLACLAMDPGQTMGVFCSCFVGCASGRSSHFAGCACLVPSLGTFGGVEGEPTSSDRRVRSHVARGGL